MRFHHSTRRGRNRLGQYSQQHSSSASRSNARHPTSTSRWSQLGYCRETNIHFNRRLPIEPPDCQENPKDSNSTSGWLNRANEQQQDFVVGKLGGTKHSLELVGGTQSSMGQSEMGSSSLKELVERASPDSGTSGLLQDHHQLESALDRLALGAENTSNSHHHHIIEAHGRPQEATSERLHITDHKQLASQQQQQQQQQQQAQTMDLDMDSVRQKLVAQVEKHPFWSNKAAKRMQLTRLKHRRIYIYELVSFCERRDLEWRFEPYRGGLVPSIPFKTSQKLDSAATASQPGTPISLASARRSVRVARPQQTSLDATSTTPNTPESLAWSLTESYKSHQATGEPESRSNGAVRRSRSSAAGSPTRPLSSGGIKPISAIECKLPDAQFVWSIEAPAHLRPEPFGSTQLHTLELPGSSFVKRCHGCQGRGRLKCASCYGVGYEVCISCSGRGTTKSHSLALGGGSRVNDRYESYSSRNSTSANGYDDSDQDYRLGSDSRGGRGNEPGGISGGGGSSVGGVTGSSGSWTTESCHFCHGAGQKRCWVCAGKSYNYCLGCQGLGQLRCYLNLNITWTNHRDESILNNSDNIIPRERLRLCSGLLLAQETSPKLRPLVRAQIDGATGRLEDSNQLHLASKRLLDKHHQAYKHERLIEQRHKVTQIQCHVVNYEWKHRCGHFVIYGDERKVYIAKYPFKSICNIT